MPEPLRQRQPFTRDRPYMGFIARLPCVACMASGRVNHRVQVAHLKWRSLEYGKRPCGKSEKPSDQPWTLPLCPDHHLDGRDAQHNVGEPVFFSRIRVNPFALCLELSRIYQQNADGEATMAGTLAVQKYAHGKEWREGLFA